MTACAQHLLVVLGGWVLTLHPLPVDQHDCQFWLFFLPKDGRDAFTYSFNLAIVEVPPSRGWLMVWVTGATALCVPNVGVWKQP